MEILRANHGHARRGNLASLPGVIMGSGATMFVLLGSAVHPYGSTSCWAGLWEEKVAERGVREPSFPGQGWGWGRGHRGRVTLFVLFLFD